MSRQRKLIIIIASVVILGLLLVLLIVKLSGQKPTNAAIVGNHIVVIDNAAQYKSSGLTDDFLNVIEPAVYVTVQNNISNASKSYVGSIRGGTFEKQTSGTISFMLDIPSLKLSWYVIQGQSDPIISCATAAQAIWTLPAHCVDLSTILNNQAADAPSLGGIGKYLPLSDVSYEMDAGYSPTDSTKLAILVTCYASSCQQDVETQIKSLGFDPTDYQIFYTKAY